MVKNKASYKRPNVLREYFDDPNLRAETARSNSNNEPVTASNTSKTSYIKGSRQLRYSQRKTIEKMLNESNEIQNLVKFLATISLCIGNLFSLTYSQNSIEIIFELDTFLLTKYILKYLKILFNILIKC
jgi:hypothetical protein